MADLLDNARDVVRVVHRREGACAEESAIALQNVVGAPIVVGTRLGSSESNIHVALQAEEHRRVQDRQVDAILVHVLEAGVRVPRRGPSLGVAELTTEGRGPLLVTGTCHTGG